MSNRAPPTRFQPPKSPAIASGVWLRSRRSNLCYTGSVSRTPVRPRKAEPTDMALAAATPLGQAAAFRGYRDGRPRNFYPSPTILPASKPVGIRTDGPLVPLPRLQTTEVAVARSTYASGRGDAGSRFGIAASTAVGIAPSLAGWLFKGEGPRDYPRSTIRNGGW